MAALFRRGLLLKLSLHKQTFPLMPTDEMFDLEADIGIGPHPFDLLNGKRDAANAFLHTSTELARGREYCPGCVFQ